MISLKSKRVEILGIILADATMIFRSPRLPAVNGPNVLRSITMSLVEEDLSPLNHACIAGNSGRKFESRGIENSGLSMRQESTRRLPHKLPLTLTYAERFFS